MSDETPELEAVDGESAAAPDTNATPAADGESAAAPDTNATPAADGESAAPGEMNTTPSATDSPAAAEPSAKPARKPRAVKPKADTPVAEEAAAEKPKRTRAAKPKATATAAQTSESVQPAPDAEPQAAPKRGAAKRREQPAADMVVRAQAKYVRSSARKARLVCDNIRGKSVTDARAILAHTPRAVARDWSTLLESAIANAENNHDLDGEDLVIKAVHADEGPTIKRFRPRAQGRASKIRKRTAHLTILLTPKN